jgi:hypothetical protein
MNYEEIKQLVQSTIWDIIKKNNLKELDNFSIELSEIITKEIDRGITKVNFLGCLNRITTNFFQSNSMTKKNFAKELNEEIELIIKKAKPITPKKIKKHENYKDAPRNDFSEEDKIQIMKNQDFRCAMCKRIGSLVQFDHKDGNRSNNNISNGQAICPNCHAEKTLKDRY